MAFKLLQAAQNRWRAVSAPQLIALVRARARFVTANSSNGPGESGGDTRSGRRAFPQGNSAGGTLLCRAADAP